MVEVAFPPKYPIVRRWALLGLCLCLGKDLGAQEQLFSEDFSGGLGGMTLVPICGTEASWFASDACASSPDAPSPPDHAQFGVPPFCQAYSNGMGPAGDFAVAFSSDGSDGSDTSSWSIQARRFSSDGSQIGKQCQVNSYTTGTAI